MQTQRQLWNLFQQRTIVRFFMGLFVVAASGLSTLAAGASIAEAHPASPCSAIDSISIAAIRGCTALSGMHVPNTEGLPIAAHSNPPSAHPAPSHVAAGSSNPFPYGQCTWWADHRYHELHGIYVPWTTNASAMNWAHLAQQFGWQVSTQPTIGAIIVLQPGIQGAYSEGHVGVVERVLNNGSVIVSSMNWGSHPTAVTQHQFHPGPGVAFVRQPS